MKTLKFALAAAATGLLYIGTAVASPVPVSDRLFETIGGITFFEVDFAEGGPETFTAPCIFCKDTAIALIETDGSVSDLLTVTDDTHGNDILTWTSDTTGTLVAPRGAVLLSETASPVDVTGYISGLPPDGLKVFIQSDVDTVPEPATAIPLALASLAMVLLAKRLSLV